MHRHITSLPIPNSLKNKLIKNGIESVNELKNLKPTDLIKDYNFNRNEINELYETLEMFSSKKPLSVYDLLKLKENEEINCISTLTPGLDKILGGGLPLGKITEICGAAGVGKTQICMQFCVNVQIPERFGGLDSKAVFIDTEGSFMSNRVVEICNSTSHLLFQKFNLNNKNDLLAQNFTVEKVLSNIFYYRCVDHVQLLACFNSLKILLDKQPSIKLIVIDSLAYPFRFVDFKDTNSLTMKTNILNNIMIISYELINKFNIAVLVTNQMTTRITRDLMSNMSSSNLVPALGETWAHSANIRILLTWKNSKRQASICKSSYLPDTCINYKITARGFEDEFDEEEDLIACQNLTIHNFDISAQVKRKKFDD